MNPGILPTVVASIHNDAGVQLDQQASEPVPMIWTSKGNLPLSALDLVMLREDEVDQVVLIETYRLKETGEEVKRSPHIIPLAPWQTGAGGRLEQLGMAGAVASIN